jgi:hypothetical protein
VVLTTPILALGGGSVTTEIGPEGGEPSLQIFYFLKNIKIKKKKNGGHVSVIWKSVNFLWKNISHSTDITYERNEN